VQNGQVHRSPLFSGANGEEELQTRCYSLHQAHQGLVHFQEDRESGESLGDSGRAW